MVGESSEFLVALEIDGRPVRLIVAGASEGDVRARMRADYRSGVICTYRTAVGTDVHIRWSNVATLGPLVIEPM